MSSISHRIIRLILTLIAVTSLSGHFHQSDASDDRGISVAESTSRGTPAWGTYHALVIGINNYSYWPRLQTAVKDAKVFHQVLIDKYGFKPENTILRIDGEASRENIIRDIRRIAVAMKKNDNLLIYYAGHGQLDDLTGDGYWIPAEGELKETWTWVPNTTIKSLLGSDRIQAKNIIVISDSCYSGAMLRGGPSLLSLSDRSYRKKLHHAATRRSRQVISSGGVEPVADGGADGHSLFAYYMIKALRENDREVIDLENLFHTKVWKPVTEIGNQRPNVGRLKSPMDDDGQFVLLNQAWLSEQRRKAREKAKRQQDAERLAQERENKRNTDRRSALAIEKERLALEREKLEMEKEILSQKQQLARESLEIERQKQALDRQHLAKQLAVATPPTASPTPNREPLATSVGLFPPHFAKRFGRGRQAQLTQAFYEAVNSYDNLRLTHTYDVYQASGLGLKQLDAEPDGKSLWVKPSFFSSPRPDLERTIALAKKTGVDIACFMAATSSHDFQGMEFRFYLINVATGKMHERIEKAVYYQTVEREVTKIFKREFKKAIVARYR